MEVRVSHLLEGLFQKEVASEGPAAGVLVLFLRYTAIEEQGRETFGEGGPDYPN